MDEPSTSESQCHMDLRHVVLDFQPKRNPAKSPAICQAEYRQMLKKDPQKWAEYQSLQRHYMSNYLGNLSEEMAQLRKQKRNEQQRERRRIQKAAKEAAKQIEPGASQRQNSLPLTNSKKVTRTSIADTRRKWKEAKKAQRDAMTPEQKSAVYKRDRERRKKKKKSECVAEKQCQTDEISPIPMTQAPSPFSIPATDTSTDTSTVFNETPTHTSTLVCQTPSPFSIPATDTSTNTSTVVDDETPTHTSTLVCQTPSPFSIPATDTSTNTSTLVVDETPTHTSTLVGQTPSPFSIPATDTSTNTSTVVDETPTHASTLVAETPSPFPIAVTGSPSPTKDSKYSFMKRVKKALPKARKTKEYVVSQLLKMCSPKTLKRIFDKSSINISVNESNEKKKCKRFKKDSNVKKLITSFFESVALDIPDKRYFSKRLGRQRKILDRSLYALYNEFVKKHPQTKVSRRNFCRSRPKHILKMKSLKFRQCLCETCENMSLMFKCLRASGSSNQTVGDALKFTLCTYDEFPSQACVERKCPSCGVQSLESLLLTDCDCSVSVTYKSWAQVADQRCKGKKTKPVFKSCTVDELIHVFCSQIEGYSLHRFLDQWQRHQFNSLKSSLPTDCALLVLDFAENYSCQHQDQAQSAYYGLDQVTIHPVVIYMHCQYCSIKHTYYRIYVSDDLKHDANFVNHILNDILGTFDRDLRFFIFSDNCGAQYKSRMPIFHLSQLAKKYSIERCFFGERHGKSECDSIGGVVKSYLTQSVVSGRATLTNAHDIYSFLQETFSLEDDACSHSHSKRTFHEVKPCAIDRSISSSEVPAFKGIKKVHSFKFLANGKAATRPFSCFCETCLGGSYDKCSVVPQFTETFYQRPNTDGRRRRRGKQGRKDKGVSNNADKEMECIGEKDGDCEIVDTVAEEHFELKENDVVEMQECLDMHTDAKKEGSFIGDGTERKAYGKESTEVIDETALVAIGCQDGKKKVETCVRRELFKGAFPFHRSVDKDDFNQFYHCLERCSSFTDMEELCQTTVFSPISIDPKEFKINLDFDSLKIAPPKLSYRLPSQYYNW